MSSNEDYLDSLLKAAMEGNTDTGSFNDNIADLKTNEKQIDKEEQNSEFDNQGFDDLIELTNEDPNKTLSPDEIEAMFARAQSASAQVDESNQNMDTANNKEEIVHTHSDISSDEEKHEEQVNLEDLKISDDPNRSLSPDEIAAMFAMAQSSESTDKAVEPKEEMKEEAKVDDLKDGDSKADDSKEDSKEELKEELAEPNEESEEESTVENKKEPEIQEEMEIDLEDPDALDLLLGIKEKPDKSEQVKNSSKTQNQSEDQTTDPTLEQNKAENQENNDYVMNTDQDLDSLLNDLGENDPELKEIGELLKKSDQHELVDDDILSLLEENKDNNEQKPENSMHDDNKYNSDIDQGDTKSDTIEEKEQEPKKEKKKKFSFFKHKKKLNANDDQENVQEEESKQKSSSNNNNNQKTQSVLLNEDSASNDINPEEQEASVDDFIQSFSSGELDEIPEKKKSSKTRKDSKSKEDKNTSADNTENNNEKPAGFFSKIFNALTEEVEEDEEEPKPRKAKKGKKGKSSSVTDANDNEGILEELDAEEDNKKKKKTKKKDKKPKKPKKVKEKKPKETVQEDNKKLPSKMVIRIFVLCFSIMALILITVNIVPDIWSVVEARNAFYKQDYVTTFTEMSGKKLSKSDERLYHKSKMILQLQHKYDAYTKYKEMNLPVEALDSLLSGYALWGKMNAEIAEYEAVNETDAVKNQIVTELQNEYQMTEEAAVTINALNDYDYTLKLEEMTGHHSRRNSKYKDELSSETENTTENEDINQDANNTVNDTSNETTDEAANQENLIQQGEAEDVLPEEGIE